MGLWHAIGLAADGNYSEDETGGAAPNGTATPADNVMWVSGARDGGFHDHVFEGEFDTGSCGTDYDYHNQFYRIAMHAWMYRQEWTCNIR